MEDELKILNSLVSGYFEIAEIQAINIYICIRSRGICFDVYCKISK